MARYGSNDAEASRYGALVDRVFELVETSADEGKFLSFDEAMRIVAKDAGRPIRWGAFMRHLQRNPERKARYNDLLVEGDGVLQGVVDNLTFRNANAIKADGDDWRRLNGVSRVAERRGAAALKRGRTLSPLLDTQLDHRSVAVESNNPGELAAVRALDAIVSRLEALPAPAPALKAGDYEVIEVEPRKELAEALLEETS